MASSEDELEAELSFALSRAERIARAAGFIAIQARRAGIESIVVTGGAAVVLATGRDFATLDIDLITPDAERLDAVFADLGFTRRNPLQHIWSHPRLGVAAQVPASFLPRHSATQEVEAPNGSAVTVWSTTDLVLDRLAQAVFGGAPDRLDQALALRLVAGEEFELKRAGERASDDGPQMTQALDAFLRLYTVLGTDGPEDAGAADEATQAFWSEVDSLGLRQ
jgi:hypothetical protein